MKVKEENIVLPRRPAAGPIFGVKTQVSVNVFDIKFKDCLVYMYDVDITGVARTSSPEATIKMHPKEARELSKYIIESLPKDVVYDGGRILFTLNALPDVSEDGNVCHLTVPDPMQREDLIITYKIMKVQTICTGDLSNFIAAKDSSSLNMPAEAIRFLNCVYRAICTSGNGLLNISRNAFYEERPMKEMRNKLFVVHRGFITSVRPQWKIRLNVDMTCKAFFVPGNLAESLLDKYRDRVYDPRSVSEITSDVRGLRCSADFYKTKDGKKFSRKMSICGISAQPADRIVIEDLNQTVAAYYKEHHGIRLKHPDMPCANVSTKRNVFIPLELLNVLPFQASTASRADIASELVRCAAVRPQERFRSLEDYLGKLAKTTHPFARFYGVETNCRTNQVEAIELAQPKVFFNEREQTLGRGKWNQIGCCTPAGRGDTLKWAILGVGNNRDFRRHSQSAINELTSAASQMGVKLDRNPNADQAMAAHLPDIFRRLKREVAFVLIILADKPLYARVKCLGDLELGLVTQCVMCNTLQKPRVGPNLMLKINGKLGGVNWSIPTMEPEGELIMTFGIDVTHPSPGERRDVKKSIAAVVGSISKDLMKYAGVVRQQDTLLHGDKATREVLDSMDTIVHDLLVTFAAKNGDKLPNRLVFYRDGVSEGQFMHVLMDELSAIQKACRQIRPNYEPAITYLVIQQRHHIRFKPMNGERNVKPGTVVEKTITTAHEYDFYLCSQEGIQGTSKPAHYFVLYDDSNWPSAMLQMFTYCLCHAFMRCTRSVSVPAPTYYSHLAAARAREWLSGADRPDKIFNENIFKIHSDQKSKMFFL